MPSKKITKKSATRPSRIARALRSTKSETGKVSRSLSKQRKSTTVQKIKRRSVAVQSNVHASLSAGVYDLKGKVVGRLSLPSEIFGVAENPTLIAQAVRVYLANQRQGNASTKNRGEVKLTTAKWYRQKGTGRARHGAQSAPIFVGGGVAFGPRPRDFSLNLPTKMKRRALFSALSGKLKDGEIKFVGGLEKVQPKTKYVAKFLEILDKESKKNKTLLVTSEGSAKLGNVYKAARNINGVRILTAATLNTYEVLDNNIILMMKESVEELKKNFLK